MECSEVWGHPTCSSILHGTSIPYTPKVESAMSTAEIEDARMQGGHVLVFPFPASGHIAPFIPFSRTLASYGVAITFLYPVNQYSRVKSLVEDESFDARENVKLFPFDVPSECGFNASLFDDLKRFMYANVEEFGRIVGRFMGESRTIQYPMQRESGPLVCIVSDMFLGFTQGIAEKFHIQRYCLFSSPVHFLSLLFHLPKFSSEGIIPVSGDSSPLKIANFPPIPPRDLPPSQQVDRGDPNSYLFLLNEANELFKAAGVLVNSVAELEHATISGLQYYFNESFPGQKMPKILPVGPLLTGLGDGKTSLLHRLREKPLEGDCFDWLNRQPDSSVLYICFGSVAIVSPSQIREMAIALENSQQRFFWVLRVPTDTSIPDLFPEGFLERTKSTGLVYFDWAPQQQILAHKAIRGFVSHCGWNSTVESISVGVPMIAWPYEAEQMMNATMVDKLLGVAIRINTLGGWYGEIVSSDKFERAIRTLMVEPAGKTMLSKVAKVSGVIEKALRPGGSSRTNLETFVTDVRRLSDSKRAGEV